MSGSARGGLLAWEELVRAISMVHDERTAVNLIVWVDRTAGMAHAKRRRGGTHAGSPVFGVVWRKQELLRCLAVQEVRVWKALVGSGECLPACCRHVPTATAAVWGHGADATLARCA